MMVLLVLLVSMAGPLGAGESYAQPAGGDRAFTDRSPNQPMLGRVRTATQTPVYAGTDEWERPIAFLAAGRELSVIDRKVNWYAVDYGVAVGWVEEGDVTLVSNSTCD
jgi:hypothetical protein